MGPPRGRTSPRGVSGVGMRYRFALYLGESRLARWRGLRWWCGLREEEFVPPP